MCSIRIVNDLLEKMKFELFDCKSLYKTKPDKILSGFLVLIRLNITSNSATLYT